MEHPEEGTLNAIDTLSGKYPYAASLLVYCIIERQVKNYLIKNGCPEDKVVGCTLGRAIGKLDAGIRKKLRGVAQRRNELMHSNMEVGSRFNPDCTRRIEANLKRLIKARRDLVKVFGTPVGLGWRVLDHEDRLRLEKDPGHS